MKDVKNIRKIYIPVASEPNIGWKEFHQKLHNQPWQQQAMHEFHTKQTKWCHYLCTVCHELWPTRVVVRTNNYDVNVTKMNQTYILVSMTCIQGIYQLAYRK